MQRIRITTAHPKPRIDWFRVCTPFLFYIPLLCALHGAALGSGVQPDSVTAAFVLTGMLSWGLLEYALHRWILHRRPKTHGFNWPGNLTHLHHHADPRSLARLNVPLREGIPVSAAYCAIAWACTGDWYQTVCLYTGLIAGYLFYEYLDFQAHHGSSLNPVVNYYREYHMLHHYCDPHVRYGVTSPLFDLLFGTYHLPVKAGRYPARHRRVSLANQEARP